MSLSTYIDKVNCFLVSLGLTMHATILAHMFSLVESGKVSEPLFAAEATQYPTNQVCVVTQALQFCLFIICTVYVSTLCESLAILTIFNSIMFPGFRHMFKSA